MRHYEELTGAKGRRVFYRADRFNVRDLFNGISVRAYVGGKRYDVQDLSMSGISFLVERDSDVSFTAEQDVRVELFLEDVQTYSGDARIVRAEPTPFGGKVAVHITSGYLDVAKLRAQYQELSLRRQLEEGIRQNTASVPAEYRLVCADALHLLRRYQNILDGVEALDQARATDALAYCEEQIMPEWREIWYRANAVIVPMIKANEDLSAIKQYTELVLTPDFMAGPIWRRSYEKPLGYPGDFQIMKFVYEWAKRGDSLFGKLVHRLGLEVAECIATRMMATQQIIAELVASQPDGPPVRIANLGCGPAQEVVNYLQLRSLPRPVHFTLIDQDQDALSSVYAATYPEVVRHAQKATVTCLHTSFNQLLKAGDLFKTMPPQNMIYSLGLVDYFSQKRARAIVAALYEQLAPGGKIVIGNMRDTPHGNQWAMEIITDWHLIYRSEAEMLDMAAGLDVDHIEVKPDSTGRVYLLSLTKPNG